MLYLCTFTYCFFFIYFLIFCLFLIYYVQTCIPTIKRYFYHIHKGVCTNNTYVNTVYTVFVYV